MPPPLNETLLGVLYPTLERIGEEQYGAIEKCKTKMIAA